jgi:MFS family permease
VRDWLTLALLVLARAMFGVQMQSAGALGPLLIGQVAADLAALGALVGAYSLPGMFFALPGGALCARFGDRAILVAGLLLMLAGDVIFALAPGNHVALAGRLVAGAGGALLNLVVVKLAMDRFAGPRLGIALGCVLSAFPLGIAAATLAMPWIGIAFGWRAAVLAGAACFVLLLLAAPLMGAGGPLPRGEGPARIAPPRWWPVMVLAVAWIGFNCAYIIAVAFGPAILVERGMTPGEAGSAMSLVSWAAMLMLPVAGWLVSRTGRPVLLALVGMGGMVVALPLLGILQPGPGLSAAAFAAGVVGGLGGTPIFALTARVLPPESRALGMGGFYTLFYLGMAALPPFAGWVGEVSGSVGGPLWVATGCALMAAVATLVVAWATRPGRAA